MINFTHLHLHTQYSILDGASNIPRLMEKAKKDGMKGVAITDHGNMFGVKEFVKFAKKNEIKPIIGCEVYVANTSRFDKDKNVKEDRSGYHLILLAKNMQGYKNLVKLVSLAWIDGFYYKPRIDKELLKQYHQGIIASTACLGGEIPENITNGNIEKAEEVIGFYKELFGDDFYLELMRHKTGDPVMDRDIFERQVLVNTKLVELAEKFNVKLIATNDVHFIEAEDAEAHDILICLNTNSDFDDPDRMRYTRQEFFKTQQEMNDLFADIPQALENTNEILDKIEIIDLSSDPIMPYFPIPDNFENQDSYLHHLTYEGAAKRYNNTITEPIKERIEYELETIKRMGFPGYFLIVRDFLMAAREMGVSVGPGRGSAAGSVVAYCNYITDIDPLKYNLLFERFLNPDRISMPDIDIDFDEDGREEVLKYVVNKYGTNRVAHITTFGTMAAKMAIRDVARVLKLPLSEADRLAKLIPERPGITFKDAFEEVPELKEAKVKGEKLIQKTLKLAEILEGSVRQTGIHACGIIIGRDDLIEDIPVCKVKDTALFVTQYEGSYVEDSGMLKMDFLGLKTLSIIKDAIINIKQSKGIEIDIEKIPLDDKKTYELYSRGDTTGLFQFESPGMKKYLRDLKPNRFDDLIAMNALYRPGPIEYIPSFIKRKNGKEKILYDLPVMEEYLKDTYGITVYQEQVMLLSQAMAGFTGGQADSLRKAMGKKIRKLMDELKQKFIDGCKKNGHDEKIALKIWTDWEAFAEYAFNKSHSTCYAYVSYQTAYLKANYPSEFMAAVLSRNISDIKKITIFMDECRRMGMQVLGPDVNESNYKFTVNKDGNIRFGLGAIKGVGEAAVLKIIEERTANGPYNDIWNFAERVSLQAVNKKSMEALALAGAFDNCGEILRHQFFATDEKNGTFIENLIRYGNNIQNDKNANQQNLFGEQKHMVVIKPEIPKAEEWNSLHKLNQEKEVIGIYLSAHPLDQYKFEINAFSDIGLGQLTDLNSLNGKEIAIAGMITDVKHATTKNGKPYGSITLEDYTDSFKLMLFSQDYINFRNYLNKGFSILIKGKIQPKAWAKDNPNDLEFKIKSINHLATVKDEMMKSIELKVSLPDISESFIEDVNKFIDIKNGKINLKIVIWDPEDNVSLSMFSRTKKIDFSEKFVDFLNNNPEINYRVN